MLQKSFQSKLFIGAIFLFLLTYLTLRAWYVAPLHDEVATFFHFIETGEIWGAGVIKDANNHLLNSWLGRAMYLLSGDSFFALRIPSVLAFILYFWSSYALIKRVQLGKHALVIFLSLNTIPWIFDYFGYTRGYGLALGFFVLSLSQLMAFLETKKIHFAIVAIVSIYFTIFSNMIYLISGALMIGYILVFLLANRTFFKTKAHLLFLSSLLVFCALLIPLLLFTIDLMKAGALYYGSLDGLWNVTGKTLSRYVFFYDSDWLKFAFAFTGASSGILFLMEWKKLGFRSFLKKESALFPYLIAGNIIAIILLAKILKVNYPEDRTGMFLVPLTFLALASLLKQYKSLSHLLWVFWIFPVIFLWKLNLNSSVFQPDDRMTEQFFVDATKQLQNDESVSVYHTMQLTYAMWGRKYFQDKHPVVCQKELELNTDLVLTKQIFLAKNKTWKKDYEKIAEDSPSSYVAIKRKKKALKHLCFDTLLPSSKTNEEYIQLYNGVLRNVWRNKKIQLEIQGEIQALDDLKTFFLVVSTQNSKGEEIRRDDFNLRWYSGTKNKKFVFNFPARWNDLTQEEETILIYLWNKDRTVVKVTKGRFKLLSLVNKTHHLKTQFSEK